MWEKLSKQKKTTKRKREAITGKENIKHFFEKKRKYDNDHPSNSQGSSSTIQSQENNHNDNEVKIKPSLTKTSKNNENRKKKKRKSSSLHPKLMMKKNVKNETVIVVAKRPKLNLEIENEPKQKVKIKNNLNLEIENELSKQKVKIKNDIIMLSSDSTPLPHPSSLLKKYNLNEKNVNKLKSMEEEISSNSVGNINFNNENESKFISQKLENICAEPIRKKIKITRLKTEEDVFSKNIILFFFFFKSGYFIGEISILKKYRLQKNLIDRSPPQKKSYQKSGDRFALKKKHDEKFEDINLFKIFYLFI